jgi:hypothetical protein
MTEYEMNEDCSWQEVYKLNGIVLNGDEDFDSMDLDEIDTIVVGFSSPLKPLVRLGIPEIVLTR